MKKSSKHSILANTDGETEIVDVRLFDDVRSILNNARQKTYSAVNLAMIEAYWNIGKVIVERQGGEERAGYGDGLIIGLSKQLTVEYGRGFAISNLKDIRQFYLTFQKSHTLCGQLSWSHYRLIMRVENEKARMFYLDEAAKGNWSVRQLDRQINSFCYERLLASRDKSGIVEEIIKKEPGKTPKDVIKDPYVLEFIGLDPNVKYYETELEQALMNHMQKFLLELGKGFTFEARQRRISFDGRHFYIDLVFYNYILKCFVLIDLKTGDLTHQDIGQMQMYVNYYTRELMNEGDNPPIGIILCANKSESMVRYTFPEGGNPQIYTSKYMSYLPTVEELTHEIETEKKLVLQEKKLLEVSQKKILKNVETAAKKALIQEEMKNTKI